MEISTKYSWHFKKDRDYRNDDWGTCKIHMLQFDKNGKLIEEQVYEEFGNNIHQPHLNIHNADWIDLWLKFDNGNKVFEVKDIDTDNYFKSNN